MTLWYQYAMTSTESTLLTKYIRACAKARLNWRTNLKEDFRENFTEILTEDDLGYLVELRNRLGARMFSVSPLFEVGDGVSIRYRTNLIPATVQKVLARKVTITLDRVWLRDNKALFEPILEKDRKRIFTLRSDGSYRLLGENEPSLLLGRAYKGSAKLQRQW